MDEIKLRELVVKTEQLARSLEILHSQLQSADSIREIIQQMLEAEAERIGIDPYEVKEF
jgi:hypothetical protein